MQFIRSGVSVTEHQTTRRVLNVFALSGILLAGAALPLSSCVPATNPFDSDTPAELQSPATVRGRATFPTVDGYLRPPDNIVVVLEAALDPARRLQVVTNATTNGTFTFDGVVPGSYFLRATANGFVAVSNEIVLRPGEVRDVGAVELGLSTDTAPVSGSVVMAEGIASNARVALVRANNDGTCPAGGSAPAAFIATTDPTGAFLFNTVPEGTYQAWVLDAQFTPAKSDVFTVVANAPVTTTPIVVQPASALVSIDAGVGAGIVATNRRDIDLTLVNFGQMNEMRFAEDDTLSFTSDWTDFSTAFVYSLLGGEGERSVYIRMRNDCVTTPPYKSSVFFDQSPPLFLSSTIFGREGVAQTSPPAVVLGNTAGSVPVQSRAFDVSGIAGVQFVINGVVQPIAPVGPTATFQASLVVASAPLESGEGTSEVEVQLVDVAGNVTPSRASGNPNAVVFRVIRDLSPPGTPIPTAEELTITSPTTLIWLDERDCPEGQDANPFVCEANLPLPIVIDSPIESIPNQEASPVFLLRGGPDYPDFAPVLGPPFLVRVFVSGDTLFEIQSQDDAGNFSAGVARVLVHREEERTLFTAPADYQLAVTKLPRTFYSPQANRSLPLPPEGRLAEHSDLPLQAAGGTAFFQLSVRAGLQRQSYYPYLIAQPTSIGALGIDRENSPFPQGIRKLSVSETNDDDDNTDFRFSTTRRAPAIGSHLGALAWMEYFPQDYINNLVESPYPKLFYTPPDENGRYSIDPFYSVYATDPSLRDLDGEPAPAVRGNPFGGILFAGTGGILKDCESIGSARCATVQSAWGGNFDEGPSEFVGIGNKIISNAAALAVLPIGTSAGTTTTVTGPSVVLSRLTFPLELGEYATPLVAVRQLEIEMGVPAGTPLKTILYRERQNGTMVPHTVLASRLAETLATGAAPGETTTETLLFDDEAGMYPTFRNVVVNGLTVRVPFDQYIGIVIPDGVTATFATGTNVETGLLDGRGMGSRAAPISGNAVLEPLVVDASDTPNVALVGRAHVAVEPETLDLRRRNAMTGIAAWDLGDDAIPSIGPVTDNLREAGVTSQEAFADEKQSVLTRAQHTDEILGFGNPATGTLLVPEEACGIVFRPTEDIPVDSINLGGLGALDDSSLEINLWQSLTGGEFGNFSRVTSFRQQIPLIASGPSAEASNTTQCVEVVQEDLRILDVDASVLPPSVRFSETTAKSLPDIVASVPYQSSTTEFAHIHDVNVPYAVSPGQIVSVVMSDIGETGDGDLYVNFGAEATPSEYVCRPYNIGSFERCLGYVVPDGVTELYVAVETYEAPIDVVIAIQIRDPGSSGLDTTVIPVAPGEVLTARTVNTSLAYVRHSVLIGWDAEPTTNNNGCVGNDTAEESECKVIVPEGVSNAYVSVRPTLVEGNETWNQEIEILSAGSIVEIARETLVSGVPFTLHRTGGGDSTVLIRQVDAAISDENLVRRVKCDTSGTFNPPGCGCTTNGVTGEITCNGTAGGTNNTHIFYVVGQPSVGGDFEATLDVPRTGCDQVSGVSSSGILKKDVTYAVTVSDGIGQSNLQTVDWVGPDGAAPAPSVDFIVGPARPELGFMGATTSLSIVSGRLVVTNLSASAPRCNINFNVRRETEFHHITGNTQSIFAARSLFVPGTAALREVTELVRLDANGIDGQTPTVVTTLPAGTNVLDTQVIERPSDTVGAPAESFLVWVEKDSEEIVRVIQKRIDVDEPVCVVAELNPPEDFLDVTLARFNASYAENLVVAGNARVRAEARLYVLDVASNCNGTLTERGRRRLTNPPVASAYEGGDLFFWADAIGAVPTDGGSLRHFDLREPTILHPGGRLSATGFDVDNGDVAVALGPEVGRDGRLAEMLPGRLVRHVLPTEKALFFHPRYVGTDGLAAMAVSTDPQNSKAGLWLFPRGSDAPPVELAAASIYLRPATVTPDPLEYARTPILESDGDLLAMVGFQSGTTDRLLTVFRLPTGREAAAQPIGTVVSVASDIAQVAVTEDIIVLIFQNGDARAFIVGNGLLEVDIDPLGENGQSLYIRTERVVGAVNGNLMVLVNPGNLFALDAPRYVEVEIRPIDAYSQGFTGPFETIELPAGAFVHTFPSIAYGAEQDEYLLYDTRAIPPVMWHAEVGGKRGTPDDGPSRPLTGGSERIGISAMPRVDGDSVYYVRGADNGGRAFMRYQRR